MTYNTTITGGTTNPIQVGAESVTVTARTNSLLVSLTWIIIGFSAIETREELVPTIDKILGRLGKMRKRIRPFLVWLSQPFRG